MRFGQEDLKGNFFLVKLLEDNNYAGPKHFDAHALRTSDAEDVWDFARGCMSTYLMLKEKAQQFNADGEIQGIFSELNGGDSAFAGGYSKERRSIAAQPILRRKRTHQPPAALRETRPTRHRTSAWRSLNLALHAEQATYPHPYKIVAVRIQPHFNCPMNLKTAALLSSVGLLSLKMAPLGVAQVALPPVSPTSLDAVLHRRRDHTARRCDVHRFDAAAPRRRFFSASLVCRGAYGHPFSAVVTGLPAGKYTIEIDLAEQYHQAAGLRSFDIAVGNQKLAENYDIFAAAGGANKVVRVVGNVEHLGDAQGQLVISFTAKQDQAKFNAIRVLNANGQVAAGVTAAQLQAVQAAQMAFATTIPTVTTPAIYRDAKRPRAARVADLIARMSLSEKVAQLQNSAPSIARLDVPQYDYWNEALHGVARAGIATVFPQAIGMAATWDTSLIHNVADTVSTEARAKYAFAQSQGDRSRYHGLTFWTPNINIYRDPRWGRGQETYGEDPFLTSRFGVAFITGLQGNDPNVLKTMACAKHFAVHSGPEPERHRFDVSPSKSDLFNTYLPAFEVAVREAKVGSVMSAYNSVFEVPAPASTFLLQKILRDKWGFSGHVVSDCGAITDVWANHKYSKSREEASSLSIKAGTDLECGGDYASLVSAVKAGLITEPEINLALSRVLDARFQLGLFDGPNSSAYARIPATENDTPAHAQTALQTARESLVLLKNDGVLPLDRAKVKTLALIGENANSVDVLLGNYNGTPSRPITDLAGIAGKIGRGHSHCDGARRAACGARGRSCR